MTEAGGLCILLKKWRPGMEALGGHDTERISGKLSEAYSRDKRTRQRPHEFADSINVGEWLSLVEHLVRDQGVGGSNPLSPTILDF